MLAIVVRRSIQLFLFSSAFVCAFNYVELSHAADGWSPTPQAPDLINTIYVNPTPIQGSQTIVIVEGKKLSLTAWAVDFDTLTVGEEDTLVADDPTNIVWSVNNEQAELSAERVASGASVELTAPLVPAGSAELSFQVTAKPDDDSTEAKGGPLDYMGTTYDGNRNDDPGTGSSITIKVIKACPPNIGVGNPCTPSTTDFNNVLFPVNSPLRVWGDLFTKQTVSGGTPPAIGNWNGLVVQEEVGLHPTDAGTMTDADVAGSGTARAGICTGGSYFIVGGTNVGTTGQVLYGCTFAASDNSFWDHHGARSESLQIVNDPDPDNRSAKTVNCKQTYKCAGGDALAPSFKITRSFTNEFKESGTRVNKVIVTKAADAP